MTGFWWPVRVIASGWWYGYYWVIVDDGGTCGEHIIWFSSALEALQFVMITPKS